MLFETAVAAPSAISAPISESEQKIFKTALLGFKRDDVLSYVESSTLEHAQTAAAFQNSISSLESSLNVQKADNETLTLKARELEGSLALAQAHAAKVEALVNGLRLEADRASDEAAAHKSCLFAKEQEIVVLKADNLRLNQTIDSLTATVTEFNAKNEEIELLRQTAAQEADALRENAREEADSFKADAEISAEKLTLEAEAQAEILRAQALSLKANIEAQAAAMRSRANDDARQIRLKADSEAVALVTAAEKEKNAAKQLISGSAESIANSITALKAELASVDRRIIGAVSELTRITGGIKSALGETEKNLQTLGVQMEKFPEPAKAVEIPTPAQKVPVQQAQPHISTLPPVYHAPLPPKKSPTESIIDKLTKLFK